MSGDWYNKIRVFYVEYGYIVCIGFDEFFYDVFEVWEDIYGKFK